MTFTTSPGQVESPHLEGEIWMGGTSMHTGKQCFDMNFTLYIHIIP